MAGKKRFALNIRKFAEIVKLRHDEVIRKLAFDILREAIEASPVDTGRFKESWRIGILQPDLETAPDRETFEDGAAKALSKALSVLATYSGERAIWVSNNVPYAVPLELGYSKQAPDGVLGPVVARSRAMLFDTIKAAKRKIPDVK